MSRMLLKGAMWVQERIACCLERIKGQDGRGRFGLYTKRVDGPIMNLNIKTISVILEKWKTPESNTLKKD